MMAVSSGVGWRGMRPERFSVNSLSPQPLIVNIKTDDRERTHDVRPTYQLLNRAHPYLSRVTFWGSIACYREEGTFFRCQWKATEQSNHENIPRSGLKCSFRNLLCITTESN